MHKNLDEILQDIQMVIDALKNCKTSEEQDGEYCPDDIEF